MHDELTPVGHNAMLDWILKSENPTLGLGLISVRWSVVCWLKGRCSPYEGVFVPHANHADLVARTANNRPEDH